MIHAELSFSIEYNDDEVEADPRELLLEILASQSDRDLLGFITVTKDGEPYDV